MYKRNKIPMQAVIRNGIVMYELTDEYRRQVIDNYLAEKPVIFERGDTLFEGGGEKDFLVDENTGIPQWLLNKAENGIQSEPDNFDFLTRPLTYKKKNIINNRHANLYANGGIYVVFPYYQVDTGLGFRWPLGHGMAIAVNDKTGETRGSEYGRYDKENNGIARRVRVPNLIAKDPSNPTEEELNLYAQQLDKMYGHSGGKTQVHYVRGADENKMIDLMQSAEKNKPDSYYQNRNYNIIDHNCGTYAADMIKESMPAWKLSGFGPYTYGNPSSIAPFWGTEGSYTQEKYKNTWPELW